MSVFDLAAATHAPVLAAGYELGVGRTVPTTAALIGLLSVVVGTLAFRARHTPGKPVRAVAALALGLLSASVGVVHGANAAGGLGTGNGLAGAIFAVGLGGAGVVLGGLTLARGGARSVGSR